MSKATSMVSSKVVVNSALGLVLGMAVYNFLVAPWLAKNTNNS